MSTLTPADVDAVCDLVDNLCGLCWDSSKAYLIESRLTNIFKRSGCANYVDFAQRVKANLLPALKSEVIDAVTTHETLWFRDNSPFEALKHKIFPEMIDAKAATAFPKRFRIWSAACSTGQEPYSIAMTLADLVPDIHRWDVQIVGTDISPASVETASRGLYSEMEMARGMDRPAAQQILHEARQLSGRSATRSARCAASARGTCTIRLLASVRSTSSSAGTSSSTSRLKIARASSPAWRRSSSPTAGSWSARRSRSATWARSWAPQFHCRANCYRPTMAGAATPALAR
jgi:chemotaxis methyl-accepting protein methylase